MKWKATLPVIDTVASIRTFSLRIERIPHNDAHKTQKLPKSNPTTSEIYLVTGDRGSYRRERGSATAQSETSHTNKSTKTCGTQRKDKRAGGGHLGTHHTGSVSYSKQTLSIQTGAGDTCRQQVCVDGLFPRREFLA